MYNSNNRGRNTRPNAKGKAQGSQNYKKSNDNRSNSSAHKTRNKEIGRAHV